MLDLATTEAGDEIGVRTTSGSHWWFTRTVRSHCTTDKVHGIFVQTDSRGFGQMTNAPVNTYTDRYIELGMNFRVSSGHTGPVEEIFLNGRRIS